MDIFIILDFTLNRLLKYNIENLEFIETIVTPHYNPVSFGIMPDNDLFIYYHPKYQRGIDFKQVFILDKAGNIQTELFESEPSSKLAHGSASNFYLYNNEMRFYLYFSNTVYTIASDSARIIYKLFFNKREFPNQDFYLKYKSSMDAMKELWDGNNNWIRFIQIYETDNDFMVKYYIKRDLYISAYDKGSGKTIHFKKDQVIDDIGIGGKIPLPIGIYENRIIGEIQPYEFDKQQVENNQLKELIDDFSEEDNPILAFYKLKYNQ